MSTPRSPLMIVCEWLEASGTSLYSLVATRVAKMNLPAGWKNTTSCVVVIPQTTTSESVVPVLETDFLIVCYGGTTNIANAEAVYAALYDRLQLATAENTTTGGIVLAELNATNPLIESDTGYPAVYATFRIKTR